MGRYVQRDFLVGAASLTADAIDFANALGDMGISGKVLDVKVQVVTGDATTFDVRVLDNNAMNAASRYRIVTVSGTAVAVNNFPTWANWPYDCSVSDNGIFQLWCNPTNGTNAWTAVIRVGCWVD